jgi:hypothetical protein
LGCKLADDGRPYSTCKGFFTNIDFPSSCDHFGPAPTNHSRASIEWVIRGIWMFYKKINLELIVPADEADGVIAELSSSLYRMEDRYTLFGGGTETVLIEHSGSRRKSALSHTLSAGKTALGAVKMARERVTSAMHLVI